LIIGLIANATSGDFSIFLMVNVLLTTLIPMVFLNARRLRDMNRSEWLQLIYFLPYVGMLLVPALAIIKGSEGDNQFD
jgi:uncharacterized membrane protein YhaH (DUF805 family)